MYIFKMPFYAKSCIFDVSFQYSLKCKIVIHCVKSGRSISIDLLSEGLKFVATIVYEVLRGSAGTAIKKLFTE